ncbi:hypothetical protein BU24DRAFT_423948 [Aaosphaeria arxii CBS 175.79]|uniref:Ams2/SPT21 N-terminal domain-containing protein n=1 Tax=Aaosphaeria arxii CBS 175.79 TaxID=1450172 RepID=A0A6A5XQ17_9PLEO|nr:uncharacterized protein BU24DRAFT_423948 [Aaosphaeria arxii CBS 175.79]KAF2015033.1 hypothetical protein BU24DRAFT_423948 [Aaosphaeria arxii CBS 175.79]
MATPSSYSRHEGMQAVSTPVSANEDHTMDEIPRRLMRVKVLYTFEDENKSNCLARVPHALSIPTVSLDENTQLGVVELKTCIQAIVTASPELVAKLGHDYTVYAYDYSEYETPLVGQGLLSRILASASPTPKAPADQSETMVTGRVCKNILGLFSNGIKETLEVKLKLIPVPTCMQKDYVENMERYHSLSQLIPNGFDYSAWSDFLKENPTIGQLTQPVSVNPSFSLPPDFMSGEESFTQLLPGTISSENQPKPSNYGEGSFDNGDFSRRPSSSAMSVTPFVPYQPPIESRPASRASYQSEPAQQFQDQAPYPIIPLDQQDDGPPKKRARITKTTRPKKAALGVNNDSLRVTASTAASVRLHRPVATNIATELASNEQAPRAPTPRPGDRFLPRSQNSGHPAARSSLRHASIDEGRPNMTSFDSGIFSDNAIDSADDERGISPGETPMDIPSSPPVMTGFSQRFASSAPSSPGLPALPYPTDSGFGSDLPQGREDEEMGADTPSTRDAKVRKRPDRSGVPWTEVNPGPMELLPKSYVPKPKSYPRQRSKAMLDKMEKVPEEQQPSERDPSGCMPKGPEVEPTAPKQPEMANGHNINQEPEVVPNPVIPSTESQTPIPQDQPQPAISKSRPEQSNAASPDALPSPQPTITVVKEQPESRSATPNPPPKRPRTTKARGLPRSHTWSGEPMSDSVAPYESSNMPRSGSGAKRKQDITVKLDQSIAAGEMPTYCNNCGEIETPTWRKAYTRIEEGTPPDIGTIKGTGIVAFEMIEPSYEGDVTPRYRIFKQTLGSQERDTESYSVLTLCNPCGLWLNKRKAMRPREQWEKSARQEDPDKPKKKRKPRPRKSAKAQDDDTFSDAIVPQSDPVVAGLDRNVLAGSVEARDPSLSAPHPATDRKDDPRSTNPAAAAALQRAIQSSPPGFMGTRNSPIEVEPDLTPKPTRRLLFPSPRRNGETKSLSDTESVSPSARSKTVDSVESRSKPSDDNDDLDKENCPPPVAHDDGLAHLFDEPLSPKTTPVKGAQLQDLLKTPTPGSRRRGPFTPKVGVDGSADLAFLMTPTRNIMTPNRNARAATIAPETPFTRQLNALLSDCITSPSQAIDFSAFPPLSLTPRSSAQFTDFMPDDFLSSDMPVPSSPPGGLGFSLYEDPATSTVGLWSGASVFGGSDPLGMDQDLKPTVSAVDSQGSSPLKTTTTEISVDFASMIEGVVAAAAASAADSSKGSSPASGAHTPDAPPS